MEKQKCPEIRFKEFSYEWQEKEFKEIFTYERPDNYIVKSTEYLDSKKTPVLTANKGFILGYTDEIETYNKPCILFDDFTLDSKYVDFSFMVKSSALKILTVQDIEVDDLYYSYYLLKQAKIEVVGHARHYIGIVQPTKINVAFFTEQQEISSFFQKLDQSIGLQEKKLTQTQNLKKAMLEKMFPKAGSTQPEIRLKGFSGDWEHRKLGDISEIKTGPFGSTLHADDYVNNGTPIVTTEHFKSGELPQQKKGIPQVSESDLCRLNNYVLKTDDIVFSRVGSVDINALVTPVQAGWLFSGRVLRVRSYDDVWSSFLHYELSTERAKNDVISRAVGQTMPSINTEILKRTKVYLPKSKVEQIQIGQFFKQLDETLVLQQQQLQTLKNLKQAFLEKMFV